MAKRMRDMGYLQEISMQLSGVFDDPYTLLYVVTVIFTVLAVVAGYIYTRARERTTKTIEELNRKTSLPDKPDRLSSENTTTHPDEVQEIRREVTEWVEWLETKNVASNGDEEMDSNSSHSDEQDSGDMPISCGDIKDTHVMNRLSLEDDFEKLTEFSGSGVIDPFGYVDHIQQKIKTTRMEVTEREIAKTMNDKQKTEERSIQRQQLERIFELMAEQSEKFGSPSKVDVDEQMKLYRS